MPKKETKPVKASKPKTVIYYLPTSLPPLGAVLHVDFASDSSRRYTQEEFNLLVPKELIESGPSIAALNANGQIIKFWDMSEGEWVAW